MTTALVTGSNGFIGSHLVEALLKEGLDVRCMVRKTSRIKYLESLPVNFVYADLTDPVALNRAVEDIDLIFHLGGKTKARNRNEFFEVNEKGTRFLLQAVMKTNPQIKRFVYVSTQAAGGPSRNMNPRKETENPEPVTWYGQSKLGGERAVLEYADQLPVTIIRPPSVYGPRDTDVFEVFRVVQWHIKPILGFQKRYASFIYVTDLIRGLILAAHHAKAIGETFYLVSDPIVSWQEMNERIAELMQRRAITIHIPVWLFATIAIIREIQTFFTRKPSILNLQKMNEFRERFWICDGSKAQRLLDFQPEYQLERGIRETLDWYYHHGWLKQARGSD